MKPALQQGVNGHGAPVARAVDHIAVAVHDADLAAHWYRNSLGMNVVGDELVSAAGVRLVYLATQNKDATTVQLVQPVAPGAVAEFLSVRGEGLHHVCFVVEDIAQVLERLGEAPGGIFRGGRGRRACFLTQQPNGVAVELTETEPIGEPIHWDSGKIGRPVDQSAS